MGQWKVLDRKKLKSKLFQHLNLHYSNWITSIVNQKRLLSRFCQGIGGISYPLKPRLAYVALGEKVFLLNDYLGHFGEVVERHVWTKTPHANENVIFGGVIRWTGVQITKFDPFG